MFANTKDTWPPVWFKVQNRLVYEGIGPDKVGNDAKTMVYASDAGVTMEIVVVVEISSQKYTGFQANYWTYCTKIVVLAQAEINVLEFAFAII